MKGHFYASIIDNELSYKSGLLGAYGYLQLSDSNLVLIHPQTAHVIHEWLLSKHTIKNPFENVMEIIKTFSGYSGLQSTYIFCEDTKQIMQTLNRKTVSHFCLKSLETDNNSTNNELVSTERTDDCNCFRIRSVAEIPETMLNCSLSSSHCLASDRSDDSSENIYSEPSEPFDYIESDIYEDIDGDVDRIYEEIITRDITEGNDYENSSNYLDFSSKPIDIKRSSQRITSEDNHCSHRMIAYDMFSKIVGQTNVSLISRSLANREEQLFGNKSEHQSEDNYYEMRPIFERQSINGFKDLDDNQYIYMKSFSLWVLCPAMRSDKTSANDTQMASERSDNKSILR